MRILKKHSTKAERKVYEVLKELGIPFRHRWLIDGKEVDFLIGKHIIEIDGHEQAGERNHFFAERGYVPHHFNNSEVNRITIKELIKNICL